MTDLSGDCYYYQEDYKNALKCLKYVVQEYYKNEKLFSGLNMGESLQVAKIYANIASIERKMSDFVSATKHIKGRKKNLI